MKAQFKVASNLVFDIEGGTQKELFENLSSTQEVFGSTACGKCGGKDLKFVVREVDDNKFYELKCTKPGCYAKLTFGAHKKGDTLFPKRKDADGNYMPHDGWYIYVAPKNED